MKTHEVLLDAYYAARREADQNMERCKIVNEKCDEYLDEIIALQKEVSTLQDKCSAMQWALEQLQVKKEES
jgi:hypothetical protein